MDDTGQRVVLDFVPETGGRPIHTEATMEERDGGERYLFHCDERLPADTPGRIEIHGFKGQHEAHAENEHLLIAWGPIESEGPPRRRT